MASITTLIIPDLGKTQAKALRKRASRVGLSDAEYVRELIKEDARLDAIAASKSFSELAEPFRRVLESKSDAELDALARPSKHKAKR